MGKNGLTILWFFYTLHAATYARHVDDMRMWKIWRMAIPNWDGITEPPKKKKKRFCLGQLGLTQTWMGRVVLNFYKTLFCGIFYTFFVENFW